MANGLLKDELLNQSILFARFAFAAYSDSDAKLVEGLGNVQCEKRLNEENSRNQTDTQALICRWNNDVVIAFRGTEGKLCDWWTDLKGQLVAYAFGPGKVHSGFKTAADSFYDYIVHDIKDIAVSNSRLFVCGHSLGGALAKLTAYRMVADTDLPPIRGVFTYGAPRLGDTDFSTAYRASRIAELTHLWVASGDPVTHVAPYSFNYRHVVAKQFSLKVGAIGITDLDSESEIASQQEFFDGFPVADGLIGTFARLKNAFLNLNTAEHSIANSYLKQLLEAKR